MEEERNPEIVPENNEEVAPNAAEEIKASAASDEAGTGAGSDLNGENLADRAKALSPGMTVLKRFFRSKLSVIGLVILVALFLFSFLGPLFSPWGEAEPDMDKAYIPVRATGTLIDYTADQAGVESSDESWVAYDVTYNDPNVPNARNVLDGVSSRHWLGTDKDGYDVLTRLMYGGRVSLTIGFVVVILETAIGVVLGLLAGYYGKWVDNLIMRIVDVLSCIPSLPLMLIMSAVFTPFGESIAKLYLMMLILCLLGWTGTARLVRGQVLSLREQEFMIAAKASGLSTKRKIFKHLLPNVVPQLIVSMTMGLGSIILMEATLGFLGIGAPLATATWGNIINLSQDMYNLQYHANLWLPSGLCITLAILAFNFVGDGLRDAFDPKMKR